MCRRDAGELVELWGVGSRVVLLCVVNERGICELCTYALVGGLGLGEECGAWCVSV